MMDVYYWSSEIHVSSPPFCNLTGGKWSRSKLTMPMECETVLQCIYSGYVFVVIYTTLMEW